MLTTAKLLDAAKRAQGITSEYRLARVLGVTDSALWNYRHGRTPDDERALKIAALAGLDARYVLVCLAAERAKDDASRAVLLASAAILGDALGIPPDGPDDGDRSDKTPRTLDAIPAPASSLSIGVSSDSPAAQGTDAFYTS
ncbi:hypothetical protein [Aquabacterium sp.]|uniref:hypothetical protein n=1 Tax=Aquabacterium sp. TaxID=1872578 RepID=UPI0025C566FB|nr:hypothetical protein [Aquabacterium sp.]